MIEQRVKKNIERINSKLSSEWGDIFDIRNDSFDCFSIRQSKNFFFKNVLVFSPINDDSDDPYKIELFEV